MDVAQVFGLGFLYPGYVADDDYPLMGEAARGPEGGEIYAIAVVDKSSGRVRPSLSKGDLA